MIDIKCETKDYLEIEDLTEFQGELKHREEADIDKIIKSIKKHGFSFPFFAWKDIDTNYVFDGHGRLKALKKLEAEGEIIPELPVVYIDAKNEAEAKELLLKLNSHYGKMTKDSVLEFLDGVEIDFEDLELPDTFIDFEIETETEETEGDDEVPEVQEEAVSKYGEIYQLGNSFLMCGDSTKEEDVARLMNGQKADMVFTDPPYGMNLDTDYSKMEYNEEWSKGRACKGGKKYHQGKVDEFHPEFIELIFNYFSSCKEIFLWGADYFAELLKDKNNGSWLVWDKRDENNAQFDKMFGSMFELCWSKNKHKREIARIRWCGCFGTEKEFDKKRFHPTQKPIKLVEWFLKKYSEENQLIVDLFGGSGSTLLTCEMNNRYCRTMELDPIYCDVIRRRYTQWAKENGRELTSGCLE